jgi:hypothetical protein
MFVTRAPREKVDPLPRMHTEPKAVGPNEVHPPHFTVTDLYRQMINPKVSSKKLAQTMHEFKHNNEEAAARPENNLQDTWVWNGRPDWEQIFVQMKGQAIDPDVGVFFCGAAVIGADLQEKCRVHSEVNGVTFSLHKENF